MRGGDLEVRALLLFRRGPAEVDERGAVDVDVKEVVRDCLFRQVAEGLSLFLRVGLVLGGVHLEVVALDEEGPLIAFLDRRRLDVGRVLRRPHRRVADLGAGDLEDDGADVQAAHRPEDGLRRVVGEGAQVERRHRETGHLAAAHRLVERLDRGRVAAEKEGALADRLPRLRSQRLALGEGRRVDQAVDCLPAQLRGIDDLGRDARPGIPARR